MGENISELEKDDGFKRRARLADDAPVALCGYRNLRSRSAFSSSEGVYLRSRATASFTADHRLAPDPCLTDAAAGKSLWPHRASLRGLG